MQIHRLFEIIYILLDKGIVTAKELAERFEVSTRTIYRDVEILSGGNIPIYMTKGKNGGISLQKDYVLNKTLLTDKEKQEILSSVQALNVVRMDKAEGVINKLSGLFGGNNIDWVEVDFVSWENSAQEKMLFNTIKQAIIDRLIVKFDYRNAQGEIILREVEPLKLCFKGQGWYLYGFCKLRSDYRFFKLRRIKNLNLTTLKCTKQQPQQILTDINFKEEFVEISLRIAKVMAYRVYDECENFETLENGDFLVTIAVPKGEWVFQYITSFGEFADIIAPQEIKEEFVKKLETIAKKYL